MGVDPNAANAILTYPPGAVGRDLPSLVDQLRSGRPTTAGVAIPGEPARLSVRLDSDVGIDPGFGADALASTERDIDISVVVRDGDGRLHRLSGDPAAVTGKDQRVEIPLDGTVDGTPVRPTFPLTLEAVEVQVAPPLNVPIVGTIQVTEVAASSQPTGDAWTSVGWDPGCHGLAVVPRRRDGDPWLSSAARPGGAARDRDGGGRRRRRHLRLEREPRGDLPLAGLGRR